MKMPNERQWMKSETRNKLTSQRMFWELRIIHLPRKTPSINLRLKVYLMKMH
jgi:hypothetical protein